MDTGRAVLGVSAAGALVLAVGLGIVIAPGHTLATDTDRSAACGSYPDGTTTAAAWFMVEFDNASDRSVRVVDVRVDDVEGADVTPLAVAPDPGDTGSGLSVTDDPVAPSEYGRTVPLRDGVTVPAHGKLDVVGRMVVRPGANAGHVRGFTATSSGPLWTTHTVTLDRSFNVGIGGEQHGAAIGCGPDFGDDDPDDAT